MKNEKWGMKSEKWRVKNELTISNQIKKRLPQKVVSFFFIEGELPYILAYATAPTKCIIHFSLFTFHLKQVESGAEEYIATIQSKLRGGTWIDKLVIVAIGLDILIRVEIKEVIHTQGQRGLRSKVVRYR